MSLIGRRVKGGGGIGRKTERTLTGIGRTTDLSSEDEEKAIKRMTGQENTEDVKG